MGIKSFFKNLFGKTTKTVGGVTDIDVNTVFKSDLPVSGIRKVTPNVLTYNQHFASCRGQFTTPVYDLSEIGKIEDTDSFVRQSFKKKEGLMFKEGIGLRGLNPDTVRYYEARMRQISQATGIPTIFLLKRIARSLIRTSNAFLIKKRDINASGGKIRTTPEGKVLKPIAGYFVAAPETMHVDINKETGVIKKWRQKLPNGRYKDFSPDDVIHFAIDTREGFLFGVPTLIPVKDDIRALRQIEENIEMLLYQHIFPLFHYIVGTESAPAGYTEEGVREVDAVRDQIRIMPAEGAIVTPERHEVKAIGSEGRALRAEGYLTHFKKRAFAGLGVSSVDMGDGDTTNRATANTLSRALVDAVKAIQDDLEALWDQYVISELLLESTFGDDVLEEENMVHLEFAEVDIQNRIEQEQHSAEMFKSNGLTWDEFRSRLRMKPIKIPEDGEDQDPKKYPEWFNTYWKLFEEPLNLIRAVDEPYSVASQVASQARSSGVTAKQQQTAQKAQEQKIKTESKEKASAQRKAGTGNTSGVRNSIADNFVTESFLSLSSDSQNRALLGISTSRKIDYDYLNAQATAWANTNIDKFKSVCMSDFIQGFQSVTGNMSDIGMLSYARSVIADRIYFRLHKIAKDSIDLSKRRIDEKVEDVTLDEAQTEISKQIQLAFDAIEYRTRFLWDTERKKARNFGIVLGAKAIGLAELELLAHEEGCDACQAISGKRTSLENISIDDVPPFHPGSRMNIKLL